jgi:dethiobiotin synthetase
MVQTIFITGTGTGVGKTLVSAIVAEALQADYWKPIQSGYEEGTDSEWVSSMLSNTKSRVYPEAYRFQLPASPHLAAKEEGRVISSEKIFSAYAQHLAPGRRLIVEGAGGLMVPLNEHELVLDLVRKINAKVIIVSRNYLGSINHSLLTAQVCRQKGIRVAGWIFNDEFMSYENDIIAWSGYNKIASISKMPVVNKETIREQASLIRQQLLQFF